VQKIEITCTPVKPYEQEKPRHAREIATVCTSLKRHETALG